MRAIDTNVLVRLIVRDDKRQVQAAEFFVEKGAWVSHVTLVETVWVLTSVYGLNADKVALAIEMLMNHQQIALQDLEVVAGALDLFKRTAKVDFSDCLILVTAQRNGHVPLGTFDRALGAVDGAERLELKRG
jgi:predicted nucleic-acid-binding protein